MTQSLAPSALPTNPQTYFRAGPDQLVLEDAPVPDSPAALERLGAAPFRKTGFPLLGFLATVYDHVSSQVEASNPAEKSQSREENP